MQSVTAELGAHGLVLKLEDGQSHYVNYLWLRDNCPTSWDPQTRDRSFDITTIDSDLVARSTGVEGNVLSLAWSDGSPESRFDLDWLLGWLRAPGRDDLALLPTPPWRSEKTGKVARFAYPMILSEWSTR